MQVRSNSRRFYWSAWMKSRDADSCQLKNKTICPSQFVRVTSRLTAKECYMIDKPNRPCWRSQWLATRDKYQTASHVTYSLSVAIAI